VTESERLRVCDVCVRARVSLRVCVCDREREITCVGVCARMCVCV
jgi:hypothetical protein